MQPVAAVGQHSTTELGGALSLFDPATGEYQMHRNVLLDQGVTDLAYADGVIYSGTSIYGGLESEPTQTTAELFVGDVEEGPQESFPVVDGAEVIHALALCASGLLWGMADTGELFQ